MKVLTSPPRGLEVSLRQKRKVVYDMRKIDKKYHKKLDTNCCCYEKGKVMNLTFELKVLEILNVNNPNTCDEETKALQYILLCDF